MHDWALQAGTVGGPSHVDEVSAAQLRELRVNRLPRQAAAPVTTMIGQRNVVERMAAGDERCEYALHHPCFDDASGVIVVPRYLHQRPPLAFDRVAKGMFAVVAAAPKQHGHAFFPRPFSCSLENSILLLRPIRNTSFGPVPPAETWPGRIQMTAAGGNREYRRCDKFGL